MNHIGIWDAELAWYSPIATSQVCIYGLEHDLKSHSLLLYSRHPPFFREKESYLSEEDIVNVF